MKQNTNIHIITENLPFFFQLLAQGFICSTAAGTSVHDYFINGIGVDEDYIAHRIQTIFLDGKAVDDVDNTVLQEGSTLALSAAMPGLVGATFRKSGYYSTLRKQISHEQQSTASLDQPVTFTLKLFNTIAKELGPKLFASGVSLNGKPFQDFIFHQKDRMRSICEKLFINKKDTPAEAFFSRDWGNNTIYLVITNS